MWDKGCERFWARRRKKLRRQDEVVVRTIDRKVSMRWLLAGFLLSAMAAAQEPRAVSSRRLRLSRIVPIACGGRGRLPLHLRPRTSPAGWQFTLDLQRTSEAGAGQREGNCRIGGLDHGARGLHAGLSAGHRASTDEMNKVFAEYFTKTPPARAVLGVARVPEPPIQISAVAVRSLSGQAGCLSAELQIGGRCLTRNAHP